jgi:hypothetical protein
MSVGDAVQQQVSLQKLTGPTFERRLPIGCSACATHMSSFSRQNFLAWQDSAFALFYSYPLGPDHKSYAPLLPSFQHSAKLSIDVSWK